MGAAFSIADAEQAQKKASNASVVMRVIMGIPLRGRISRQQSFDII
jgi:hypothetical protein